MWICADVYEYLLDRMEEYEKTKDADHLVRILNKIVIPRIEDDMYNQIDELGLFGKPLSYPDDNEDYDPSP